jgi:hypothetical protein
MCIWEMDAYHKASGIFLAVRSQVTAYVEYQTNNCRKAYGLTRSSMPCHLIVLVIMDTLDDVNFTRLKFARY